MRLGALLGPVSGKHSHQLADQARTLADLGYRSLWTAQAINRGFMLPDPFIALSVAAAVTTDVELGTAIVQVPLYHPADLAHRVFSLQQIAGERLLLGVGAGSTERDFAAFERDYATRFTVFDQALRELRDLFATGAAGAAELTPWPAVLGGPPLLYGTWGRGVVRAAGEFDGWIASGHYRSADELRVAHARYRAAGGQRAIVSTIQLGAQRSLADIDEQLHGFADMGFDDAVVMFLPGGPRPEQVIELLN